VYLDGVVVCGHGGGGNYRFKYEAVSDEYLKAET
jgi:hypothetical protein